MIHNHEVPGSIPGLATRNALRKEEHFLFNISSINFPIHVFYRTILACCYQLRYH